MMENDYETEDDEDAEPLNKPEPEKRTQHEEFDAGSVPSLPCKLREERAKEKDGLYALLFFALVSCYGFFHPGRYTWRDSKEVNAALFVFFVFLSIVAARNIFSSAPRPPICTVTRAGIDPGRGQPFIAWQDIEKIECSNLAKGVSSTFRTEESMDRLRTLRLLMC
jgi:hypothetical protein